MNLSIKDSAQTMVLIPQKEYHQLLSLKDPLAELKRMIFGSRSEKFIATSQNQLGLFNDISPTDTVLPVKEKISYERNKPSKDKNKQPVRGVLPAHLPRVEEIIEPDTIKQGAKQIGQEVTEILEYNPAKLFVRKIIRPKYALKNQGGIVIGELPTVPIPKSNAGASLLAHITVSKFVDHLPFYRQRQIFKRQNFVVSDSTLGGWFTATADLLAPLYQVLQKQVLKSDYIQADESPIGVQDSHKKGSLHTGYQWVYRAPVEGLVLFRYDKSRSRLAAKQVLNHFSGALQTDGYKVYQNLDSQGNITLLGCMAHARRYFEKALENDKNRAEYALTLFQKLYAIERKARDRSITSKTRKRYRDLCAIPILTQMEQWLKEQINLVLPKSLIGKAIGYTLNLWENLKRYTLDGKFEIDNNLVENTIRPLALGRKNYLFAGSHKAAQRIAMFYSFFATCKINGVEPLQWLTHVLQVIPDYKANKLAELLPTKYLQENNEY